MSRIWCRLLESFLKSLPKVLLTKTYRRYYEHALVCLVTEKVWLALADRRVRKAPPENAMALRKLMAYERNEYVFASLDATETEPGLLAKDGKLNVARTSAPLERIDTLCVVLEMRREFLLPKPWDLMQHAIAKLCDDTNTPYTEAELDEHIRSFFEKRNTSGLEGFLERLPLNSIENPE